MLVQLALALHGGTIVATAVLLPHHAASDDARLDADAFKIVPHTTPAAARHRSNQSLEVTSMERSRFDGKPDATLYLNNRDKTVFVAWLIGLGVAILLWIFLFFALMRIFDQSKSTKHLASSRLFQAVVVFITGCIIFSILMLYIGHTLKAAVTSNISQKSVDIVGVQVDIGHLHINPFNGVVWATNLVVSNPRGFKSKYLLNASRIHMDIHMMGLLSSGGDMLQVSALGFEGINVIYEKGLTSSNVWDASKGLATEDDNESQGSAAWSWNPKLVVINQVWATDIRVKLTTSLAVGYGPMVNLKDIQYDNFAEQVGTFHSGGDFAQDLLKIVLDIVMKQFTNLHREGDGAMVGGHPVDGQTQHPTS